MNMRKWRNPYAPMTKKKIQPQEGQAGRLPVPLEPLSSEEVRSSVNRMRLNIKGISSTIRQVENTMDTLYGAMEILESLSRTSAKPAQINKAAEPKRHRGEQAEEEDDSNPLGPLGNIDIGQLLNLLQSPLVQNLLKHQADGADKRKKEG
ncbi:hypothetical protein ACI7RC_11605 [Brevibacillus sp. B_LB10_24]|uniref:hypothetical protein n=1 Tax=Brevibacillus sp. B_LB10_24 TaxID=3380645 RepID=UPI0038BD2150